MDHRATTAQWHAERAARRPKRAKLAENAALRAYVQDRLSGVVSIPDGTAVAGPAVAWKGRRHGPRKARRWANAWSPEQISRRLRHDHPDDETMRISHEAIYQALCVQGCGALRPAEGWPDGRRELTACLRTGRALRVPRARSRRVGKSFVAPEVLISQRPAEAADRAVPGHWEGDLILGLGSSAIGALVERTLGAQGAKGSRCCSPCLQWKAMVRVRARRTALRWLDTGRKRCATRLCARSRPCRSSSGDR